MTDYFAVVKTYGDSMSEPEVRLFLTQGAAEAALKEEYYKACDEVGEDYLSPNDTSLMRYFATVTDGMGSYVNFDVVEVDVEEK